MRRTCEMGSGRARALASLGLLFYLTPVHCIYADTETVLPLRAFSGLAVDDRRHHLFVSQGDSITVVDFDGHIVTSIENQPGAAGMLVDSAHRVLYVALSAADAVSEIDTDTLVETRRRSLGLGVCPWTLAITHRRLWFGFLCFNGCDSCTRQPHVGGIGSLDPRRGDIVAYDEYTSGFRVPFYFPLLPATQPPRHTLIAAEGGLSPTDLYRYHIRPDGSLYPEIHAIAPDEHYTLDVAIERHPLRVVTGAFAAQTGGGPGLSVFRGSDLSYEFSYRYQANSYNVVAVASSSKGHLVAGGISDLFSGGGANIFIFARGDPNPIGVYDFSSDGSNIFQRGLAFDRKAAKLFAVTENSVSATLHILNDPRHPPPTTTTTTTTTTSSSTFTTTTIDYGPCRIGYDCSTATAYCYCAASCTGDCAPLCTQFFSRMSCQTDADCASIPDGLCVQDPHVGCSTTGCTSYGICGRPCPPG